MNLEQAVRDSWAELLEWVQLKTFKPENEEDIQSFLYYGLVKRLQDATLVKPKRTTGKPPKIGYAEGKLQVGNMHFPDLLIGSEGEIVVEIKFMREQRTSNILSGCKRDIEKMLKHHSNQRRFFVLYDVCSENIFLSTHQLSDLRAIDPACEILMYPLTPNDSNQKKGAALAIANLKARGYDFKGQAKLNAAKVKMQGSMPLPKE